MEQLIMVKYGEIHLKGLNRPFFERMLINNIKKSLPNVKIEKGEGRYYIHTEGNLNKAVARLKKIFGIHAFCVAYCLDNDLEQISEFCLALIKGREYEGKSFKIAATRSNKKFPMKSTEIAAAIGGYILQNTDGLRVDLTNPDITITVEVREKAYVYTENIKGAGGMPVGSGGNALLLLSGGIDSPVAGWMMAKRGVKLYAVHFYSFPYTSEHSKQKVVMLTEILSQYSGEVELFVVPFTEIQEAIYTKCPHQYTTIIMRRFMMKIAEAIARDNGCGALITGESLGQVASQTLDSIIVTDNAVNLPVFRPLIGFDKNDIVDIARNIDTFETSILPYEDCCTVFTPRHPATHPNLDKIVQAESALDGDEYIKKAIAATERLVIRPD
ncbi:MAG TPA: tRNA uracil 4-sulfurtransferase ThiI [Clostridia bacterium]|nr:tRNA uracil 4-sulfurtransferase ThiI [Clostridia bacterium]